MHYSSKGTMYAFFDRVFSRFGTLVEVFTNQDMEFCMKFYELCEKMFIDNQIASWDHHKANGLVERMVQKVKLGLCKYGML